MELSKRIPLSRVFQMTPESQEIVVAGWIRSVRKSKNFAFIVLNDGTTQATFQLVIEADHEKFEELTSLGMGTCALFQGKLVPSGGKGQSMELQVSEGQILGEVSDSYPLQKKATSLEFLRENAHLRPRTNLFGAVFRIRHALAMATHQFFDERGFYYLNSPIITAVDAEGAGEMFHVSTLEVDDFARMASTKEGVTFKDDYFGKETSLCVTGQLEGECFALGMGQVYTFGPTFRAENSNTSRHLAEFWMIEPEAAFMELEGCADLACDYIKHLINHALKNCQEELQAIEGYQKFSAKQMGEKYESHLPMIEKVGSSSFERITYTKAIEILKDSGVTFEYEPEWGKELQTEHERYLTDKHFRCPVVVTDYPKDCKAFYMKQNEDGKTVRAMDVLVPGVGEIIGGSQREESLEKIERRIDELGMNKEPLWWYLDLRRFGSAPHSGFGLGFERALMYITGMKNIRDVIPFPRTPRNCDF